MRTVVSFLRLWVLDPFSIALLCLAGWWGRSVLLPGGTWLATRLTRLALRIAPEVVLAETQDTSRAWADLFTSREWWELRPDDALNDAPSTLPMQNPAAPAPLVSPAPSMREVATLSVIAAALDCDPDPLLPDDRVLARTLANAIREVETHTPGWQDRLASDLTLAVLCLPRRIDERLQTLLDEAQKLASEDSQATMPLPQPWPPADGVA